MEDFKRMLSSIDEYVEIRDSNGTVYTTTSEPAVVFDLECNVLLKTGSFESMMDYLNKATQELMMQGTFEAKLLASCMAVLILPCNQELVDKVVNNTGYLGLYIERATRLQEEENIK